MKINMFSKKVFAIVTAVVALIIAAGLALFFVFGFNTKGDLATTKSVTVKTGNFVAIRDTYKDELLKICNEVLDENSLKVSECTKTKKTDGYFIEFIFSADASDEALEQAAKTIQTRAETNETIGEDEYVVSWHTQEPQIFTVYIWRAAIAVGVVAVCAFVYIFLRYGLAAGITSFIQVFIDVLLTLALIVLCRIPVTSACVSVALMAAFAAVVTSFATYNATKRVRTADGNEKLGAEEIVSKGVNNSRFANLVFSAVIACGSIILLAIATTQITLSVLPALVVGVVALFSSQVFAPSVYSMLYKALPTGKLLKK